MLYREGIVVSRINCSKVKQNYNIQYVLIYYTLELRNLTANGKEISTYVFREKELRGLSPDFHNHTDLYTVFSRSVDLFFLQQNRQTDRAKISLTETFYVGLGTIVAQFLF